MPQYGHLKQKRRWKGATVHPFYRRTFRGIHPQGGGVLHYRFGSIQVSCLGRTVDVEEVNAHLESEEVAEITEEVPSTNISVLPNTHTDGQITEVVDMDGVTETITFAPLGETSQEEAAETDGNKGQDPSIP